MSEQNEKLTAEEIDRAASDFADKRAHKPTARAACRAGFIAGCNMGGQQTAQLREELEVVREELANYKAAHEKMAGAIVYHKERRKQLELQNESLKAENEKSSNARSQYQALFALTQLGWKIEMKQQPMSTTLSVQWREAVIEKDRCINGSRPSRRIQTVVRHGKIILLWDQLQYRIFIDGEQTDSMHVVASLLAGYGFTESKLPTDGKQ